MSRSRHRPRSDEEILASEQVMDLLAAVAAGEVVRGAGGDTALMAPHMWRGHPIRLDLWWMREEWLVRMPLSGPPRVAARGEKLLKQAGRWSGEWAS